jgi:SAM-dependent methyltransferase
MTFSESDMTLSETEASWYSLLHTGNAGDVEYYVKAAEGASSVLELGCGSGRIALAIAKSGVPVVAVDNSKAMLSLLETARTTRGARHGDRIETVLCDMQRIDLERKFDRILIPYNGLLCLLSKAAVVRCLRCAAAHMNTGGELIFDVYDVPMDAADDKEVPEESSPDFEYLTTIRNKGREVAVYERSCPHKNPRRFDTAYRYFAQEKSGKMRLLAEYTIRQRCIYKEEIPELLSAAGLQLISMTGDFVDGTITDDTEQVVVRAKKR